MSAHHAVITSTGSYLPEKILTNQDLAKHVDTSDEWIRTRTGIEKRHIAAKNEGTADMASCAARRALESANISPLEIDFVIVATTTPDQTFPSVATKVQAALGLDAAAAFDVQAVCSGFIYALSIANNFIITGQARHVLVIGAEKMSSLLDWTDRATCVLFGDGAGAILLSAHPTENKNLLRRGILSTHLAANGHYRDILYTSEGLTSTHHTGYIQMNGQEVFKHAVSKMTSSIEITLAANHLSKDAIHWLVPHQANMRILEMLTKKLQLDPSKIINCIANHANTSAASIPLALDDANRKQLFKPHDLLILCAVGGGLTWGSCALYW